MDDHVDAGDGVVQAGLGRQIAPHHFDLIGGAGLVPPGEHPDGMARRQQALDERRPQ